ncbi:MAG: oligosaccharide flippase family protein [Owenweeksia sp.]|nr:oligosaccharide flippase family protein [Owenweeksia sp.]
MSLAAFELALLYKNKPYRLSFQFDLGHYKRLLKTGLPIFGVGNINPLWTTVMNNFIVSVGGPVNFGLYAISNIIRGAVGVIPSAFGQVIYPRMAIMLGEGKGVSQILRSNIKPLIFQFGMMLGVGIIGALLLPLLVPFFLPKYTGGIEAAQWMIFVPAVQSFGALNNMYNVVKKQKWYFVSLLSGAILGSLFIFFRYNSVGFQLATFPQGLLIGQGIQQILALLLLNKIRVDA